MFHPKSPYFSVCADVVVTAPVGKVEPHEHQIPQPQWNNPSTSSQPSSKSVLPDSDPVEPTDVPEEKGSSLSFPKLSLPWQRPSSQQVSQPSGANLLVVWQEGRACRNNSNSSSSRYKRNRWEILFCKG